MKRVFSSVVLFILCLNCLQLPAEAAEVLETGASDMPITMSCDTVRDMADILEYMMSNGLAEYSIVEPAKTWNSRDMLKEAFSIAEDELVEYWTFFNVCSLRREKLSDGMERLTFFLKNRSGLSQEEVSSQFHLFEAETEKMFRALCMSGILTEQMTDKEKALALNNYVGELLEYDVSYASSTAYESLRDGKAVCHGYTAIYNRLCHLAGLSVSAQRGYGAGQYHVWSKFSVGNESFHVDVTWNDSSPKNVWFWQPLSRLSGHVAIN